MMNMKPILIAVAGGSASGKTTVVKKIIERLNSKDITVITHDDICRWINVRKRRAYIRHQITRKYLLFEFYNSFEI